MAAEGKEAADPPVPPPLPPPAAAAPSPPPGRLAVVRAWLFQLVLPVAGGVGLILGLTALGGHLRQRLNQSGGQQLTFTAIDVDPPPGMERAAFLEEVQYLANLPDRLNPLDPATIPHIRAAVAAHPWVSGVRRVQLLPAGRVQVEADYRTPVLAVARPPRVVDGDGILLPASAPRQGLPVLAGAVAPPAGKPGEPWGDAAVRDAAAIVTLLRPHLSNLKLEACTIDYASGEVTLRTPRVRLLWGRAPGKELADEAAAEVKRKRLLEAPPRDGEVCDVRPAKEVRRRPLAPTKAAPSR
ncbi:MAG: hypothetical protein U0736_21260 [Gemmataceae bacterium]